MAQEKHYYRRDLPHYHPADSVFFITFRLANSLPAHIWQELLAERERERRELQGKHSGAAYRQALYELEKKHFGRFDTWLDRCTEGPRWLAEERIAQIVAHEIHALDGHRYHLLAYCVMSNHVHLLIDTTGYGHSSPPGATSTASYPLAETLRLLKGRTARYCNQALGRSGIFWHDESYDHVVRDEVELRRIVWYIANNPVKAGLVKDWKEWKFTFVSTDIMDYMF